MANTILPVISTASTPKKKEIEAPAACVPDRKLSEHKRSLIACILFVTVIWALNAYFLLRSQTVFISNMPVDVLHALLGAERIRLGEVPHVDFHTPIGALAFYILAWLGDALGDIVFGLKVSNVVAGTIVLLGVTWLGLTRLSQISYLLTGVFLVMLSMSFSWDEAASGVTFAMYYNRWGWALFILALLLCLPPRNQNKITEICDVMILAFVLFVLAYMKVSFFVTVIVGTAIGATIFRRTKIVLYAYPVLVVISAVVIGLNFMPLSLSGYLQDIIDTANSPLRVRSMTDIANTPLLAKNIGQTIAVIILILIFFRLKLWGLMIFTGMVLGFTAANAVQNYGNGLAGYFVAAILAVEFIVPHSKLPKNDQTLATIASALIFAAAIPMVYYSHLTLFVVSNDDETMAAPFLEPSPLSSFRISGMDDGSYGETRFHLTEPITIGSENISSCAVMDDHIAYFREVSRTSKILRESGLEGGDFVATIGLIDPFWLTAEAQPLPGAHLWYMGKHTLPSENSLAAVRFLVVRKCQADEYWNGVWSEVRKDLKIDFSNFELRYDTDYWLIFENPNHAKSGFGG